MHCFCAVSCNRFSVRHACRFEETNSCFHWHSSHAHRRHNVSENRTTPSQFSIVHAPRLPPLLLSDASENLPLIGIRVDIAEYTLYTVATLPKITYYSDGHVFKASNGAHLRGITAYNLFICTADASYIYPAGNPKEGYSRLHNRETYT